MILRNLLLIAIFLFMSSFIWGKDGRLGKAPNEYSYASFGLLISYNDSDNIGFYGSLPLPGPLYVNASRIAYGTNLRNLDDEKAEFEKTVNTLVL